MSRRVGELLALIDPASSKGLEIGPLDRPIVTPGNGEIAYVDHLTTEGLREKYADDSRVIKERLVEIDYVWEVSTLREAVGRDQSFDYIIASHVLEHVPDLIGWLREAHEVLRSGGLLSLAIPDRRYTFDFARRTSTAAEAVDMHLATRRTPSPRQVYDHYSHVVYFDIATADEPSPRPEELRRKFSDESAYGFAKKVADSSVYLDVHTWVFTPASFFGLYGDLVRLGLVDFDVARFAPRIQGGNEFYVTLRALPTINDPSCRLSQIGTIPRGFPNSTLLPGPDESADGQDPETKEPVDLEAQIKLREERIAELLESTSWRATAPLRWTTSKIRKLKRSGGSR